MTLISGFCRIKSRLTLITHQLFSDSYGCMKTYVCVYIFGKESMVLLAIFIFSIFYKMSLVSGLQIHLRSIFSPCAMSVFAIHLTKILLLSDVSLIVRTAFNYILIFSYSIFIYLFHQELVELRVKMTKIISPMKLSAF